MCRHVDIFTLRAIQTGHVGDPEHPAVTTLWYSGVFVHCKGVRFRSHGADVGEFPNVVPRCGVPDVHILPQRAKEVGGARVVLRGRRNEELLPWQFEEKQINEGTCL